MKAQLLEESGRSGGRGGDLRAPRRRLPGRGRGGRGALAPRLAGVVPRRLAEAAGASGRSSAARAAARPTARPRPTGSGAPDEHRGDLEGRAPVRAAPGRRAAELLRHPRRPGARAAPPRGARGDSPLTLPADPLRGPPGRRRASPGSRRCAPWASRASPTRRWHELTRRAPASPQVLYALVAAYAQESRYHLALRILRRAFPAGGTERSAAAARVLGHVLSARLARRAHRGGGARRDRSAAGRGGGPRGVLVLPAGPLPCGRARAHAAHARHRAARGPGARGCRSRRRSARRSGHQPRSGRRPTWRGLAPGVRDARLAAGRVQCRAPPGCASGGRAPLRRPRSVGRADPLRRDARVREARDAP